MNDIAIEPTQEDIVIPSRQEIKGFCNMLGSISITSPNPMECCDIVLLVEPTDVGKIVAALRKAKKKLEVDGK